MNSPASDGQVRPLVVIFCEPDRLHLDALEPVIGGRQVAWHAIAAPLLWKDDGSMSRYEGAEVVVVVSRWLVASGALFSESFRVLIVNNSVVSVVVEECNWRGTPVIETPVLAPPLDRRTCQAAMAGDRVTAAKTGMMTPEYDHPEHLVVGEQLAALHQLWGEARDEQLRAAIERVETPLSLAHGWVPGRIIANRFRLVRRSDGVGQFRSFHAWDLQGNCDVWVQSLPLVTPMAQQTLDYLTRVSDGLRLVGMEESLGFVPAVVARLSSEQGVAYRVIEFAHGDRLEELDARTHCRVTKLNRIRQVASTVQIAHSHGLAHGRLSPARIRMVSGNDNPVLLLGFGLQRHTFTQTDLIYLAPEILSGEQEPTTAADVYSVAMMLCIALVGPEFGRRMLSDGHTVLTDAGLSAELVNRLSQGIAYSASQRPPDVSEFVDSVLADEGLLREFAASPSLTGDFHTRKEILEQLMGTSPSTDIALDLMEIYRSLGDTESAYNVAIVALKLARHPTILSTIVDVMRPSLDPVKSHAVRALLVGLTGGLAAAAAVGVAQIVDNWGTLDERAHGWYDAFSKHQTRDQADMALAGMCVVTKAMGDFAAFVAWADIRLPYTHGTVRSQLLIELASAKARLNQVEGCVEAARQAIDQGANLSDVMAPLSALPIHDCWRSLAGPLMSWAPVDSTGLVVPLLATVASVARMSQSDNALSLHEALLLAQPDDEYVTDYLVANASTAGDHTRVLSLVEESPHGMTATMACCQIVALVATSESTAASQALSNALNAYPSNCALLELAIALSLAQGDPDIAFGYAQRRLASQTDALSHILLADTALWCGLTAHAARHYQLSHESDPECIGARWGVEKVAAISANDNPTPWYAQSFSSSTNAGVVAEWLANRVAVSSLLALLSGDPLGLAGQQRFDRLSRLAIASMVVELHARRGALVDSLLPLLRTVFSDVDDDLSRPMASAQEELAGIRTDSDFVWRFVGVPELSRVVVKPRLSLVVEPPDVSERPSAPMPPVTSDYCRLQISTGDTRLIDAPISVGGGEDDDWLIDGLPERAFRLSFCGGLLYATAENAVLMTAENEYDELCLSLCRRFSVGNIRFSLRAPELAAVVPDVQPPVAVTPLSSSVLPPQSDIAPIQPKIVEVAAVYCAELVIDDGSLLGRHYTLDGAQDGELSVGRVQVGSSASCDLVLNDESIAPVHCVLVEQDGIWNIEDRAGSGSTRVNDRSVIFHQLQPGDHITIGLLELEFHLVEIPQTTRNIG